MAARLKGLSYYHLLYELLQDGRSGAFPAIEPIAVDELLEELTARSKTNLGQDRDKWVHWFMTTPGVATLEEKKSIATVKKIWDIEKKGSDRTGKDN